MRRRAKPSTRRTSCCSALGDFVFPVVAEIKFDNGETIREKWDGQDRWKRYVYLKKAKVLSVEIDPDHQVTMDRNYLNNSIATEAAAWCNRRRSQPTGPS